MGRTPAPGARRNTGYQLAAIYDLAVSFSGVGLALDMIGGLFLTLLLYRHSQAQFPGWSRDPVATTTDRTVGTVGALFLVLGFLGQLLGAAGFGSHRRTNVLVSALVAFGWGWLLAYVLFGVGFILWMRYELWWMGRERLRHPEQEWRNQSIYRPEAWHHAPNGLHFWRYEARPEEPNAPDPAGGGAQPS